MIKKFDEFVNEGMWKSGVERAKSNELRKEDRLINSNLYELQEVDLGLSFNFADRLFATDEHIVFCDEDFDTIKQKIKLAGWRLPTKREIKELIAHKSEITNNGKKEIEPQDEYIQKHMNKGFPYITYSATSNITNQTLDIYWSDIGCERYYMLNDDKNVWCIGTKNKAYKDNPFQSRFEERRYFSSPFVWLVRDKKPVNEGLWKDGIERAKSGEERIEDRVPPFFKRDGMYQVQGYKGYYFTLSCADGDTCFVDLYVCPNEERFTYCYDSHYTVGECAYLNGIESFALTPLDWEGVSEEVKKTVYDKNFVDAINTTMRKLPKDIWHKLPEEDWK